MAEMSELYGDSANNTTIEERLEKTLKSYMSHIPCYFRGLSEEDEKKFKKTMKSFRKNIKRYTTERRSIADLDTNMLEYDRKIKQELIEQKKYVENININDTLFTTEEILALCIEPNKKLNIIKCDQKRKLMKFMDRCIITEDINRELRDNLHLTPEELARKEKELEKAVETAKELSTNLMALELSKITPASNIYKENPLFAEVEDPWRMLSDKMELFMNSHNHIKQMLNTKITVIKMLKADKSATIKKWETDMMDTSQGDEDLLNEYRRKIFELKDQIIKSNQVEDAQVTDDFHYFRSLITAKGKKIEELNEKILEKDIYLFEEEVISTTLMEEYKTLNEYWRSKAMSLEAENLALKTQLEREQINNDANI